MKRLLLVLCAALATTGAWAAKEMSVQVREGQLRSRASFLATVTGTVVYGDRVLVKQTLSGWCEVSTPAGRAGWIHESALTPKRVVLTSGTGEARVGASGEEVVLAGKGFSEEVEREYKMKNAALDYAWVDWMVLQKIPAERLVRFLEQGDLIR